MAWVYTAVLVACSAGVLALGAAMTVRLFRDETLTGGPDPDGADRVTS